MFASNGGDTTPPCGVPLSLRRRRGLPFSSFSSTGARSHCLIKRRTLPSTTRIRTHAISLSCGIAVEAAFHIRVINRAAPVHQILPNDFQRVVRTPPGSKPIRAIQKVRFKDRFQDQHYRCLHHPITQVRDAQWPLACHSLWGYTPCAPLPCHSASGQARSLTLKGRLPRPPSRFAQYSLHLLPAHRHWLVLASKPLATSRDHPPARKGCRSEIASPVWLSYSASLASPGVSPAASLLLPVAPLPAFLS